MTFRMCNQCGAIVKDPSTGKCSLYVVQHVSDDGLPVIGRCFGALVKFERDTKVRSKCVATPPPEKSCASTPRVSPEPKRKKIETDWLTERCLDNDFDSVSEAETEIN